MAGEWWLCPNTPRCGHGAVLHDVEDAEDPLPRCCVEGCRCGDRAVTDQPDRAEAGPPCPDCDGPPYACANCRRPLYWVEPVGWLHGDTVRWAGELITCGVAEPVHLRQGSRHGR